MCVVNRISAEPPTHLECAEFSVKACPFLTKPHMVRRENDLPEGLTDGPGFMIRRNPGCVAIWVTRRYALQQTGEGVLFKVSDPETVTWWREGRAATRAEAIESLETGLPALMAPAEAEGPDSVALLKRLVAKAMAYFPTKREATR
jgi:hypothetical protein